MLQEFKGERRKGIKYSQSRIPAICAFLRLFGAQI